MAFSCNAQRHLRLQPMTMPNIIRDQIRLDIRVWYRSKTSISCFQPIRTESQLKHIANIDYTIIVSFVDRIFNGSFKVPKSPFQIQIVVNGIGIPLGEPAEVARCEESSRGLDRYLDPVQPDLQPGILEAGTAGW